MFHPYEPKRHIIPTCICMHSHVTWILYESMSHWSPQSYGQSALSFFIYQSHPSIQIHITFCCLLCFVVFYFLFVWMVLIMSATWKPHWASRLRWVDDYSIPTTSYVCELTASVHATKCFEHSSEISICAPMKVFLEEFLTTILKVFKFPKFLQFSEWPLLIGNTFMSDNFLSCWSN